MIVPEPRCLLGRNMISLSDPTWQWSSTRGRAPGTFCRDCWQILLPNCMLGEGRVMWTGPMLMANNTILKNRQNFQMNGPKISGNTAKRVHHLSDRAPCPPASFKISENSWAGGLNALCTLKKLGEGKRSKNSCPWGKSWSMDLISANFVIFYNFVSASGASSSPKSTVPAQPTWMSCRITPLGRRWWGGWC